AGLGDERAVELGREILGTVPVARATRSCSEQAAELHRVRLGNDNGMITHCFSSSRLVRRATASGLEAARSRALRSKRLRCAEPYGGGAYQLDQLELFAKTIRFNRTVASAAAARGRARERRPARRRVQP